MEFLHFLGPPLAGALTGWVTVTLAVRLLFHPKRPVHLLGLTLQGILPARRGDLARAVAEMVTRNLPARADLPAMLERPEIQASVEGAIRGRIHDFLENKIKALNPMLGMVLGGSLREKIEEMLIRELMRAIPELIGKLMENMGESVDVRPLVEEKVRGMDLDELERTVQSLAGRQLRQAALGAGALGLGIGLMIAVLIFLI